MQVPEQLSDVVVLGGGGSHSAAGAWASFSLRLVIIIPFTLTADVQKYKGNDQDATAERRTHSRWQILEQSTEGGATLNSTAAPRLEASQAGTSLPTASMHAPRGGDSMNINIRNVCSLGSCKTLP